MLRQHREWSDDVPEPPRRREVDKERRRWSDSRMDDYAESVNRRLTDLEQFRYAISKLQGISVKVDDLQDTVKYMGQRMDRNFDRNFSEHAEVKVTATEIAANVRPTTFGRIKDMAAIVSLLLVPILA